MRGAFLGRGGGFYFVRLENKNPYLGEPRWTTSGWPASSSLTLKEYTISLPPSALNSKVKAKG